MASSAQSANFEQDNSRSPLVSRHAIGETIRDALHLHVGRGRRFSVKDLAEGAGIPERCIEAAKCQPDDPEYRPLTLENLASICKFLRAPFASAFLAPAELGAFELMDGQIPLPKVLATADPVETIPEKRRRLLRELQALEDEE